MDNILLVLKVRNAAGLTFAELNEQMDFVGDRMVSEHVIALLRFSLHSLLLNRSRASNKRSKT